MLTSFTLRISDFRTVPGCSADLAEPTALVEIDCGGRPSADFDARIRAGVIALYPEQELYRVGDNDWPAAFLVGPPSEASDLSRLGEWVVALSIALQRWAGVPVWRGQVVGSDPGRLLLAVPWRWEWACRDALEHGVRLVAEWANSDRDSGPGHAAEARAWIGTALAAGMVPNMLRYIQAAVERDIPFEVLAGAVQLGWGAGADRILESRDNRTGAIGVFAANNKLVSNILLSDATLPLPGGEVAGDPDRALAVAEAIGWPVVAKPLDGGQGKAVAPNITDPGALRSAFMAAHEVSPDGVIIEKHVDGDDHRLLVINGRMIAAARRTPAGVTGDGIRTVGELVDRVNADPRRVSNPNGMLKLIVIDDEARRCLSDQGCTLDSVVEPDRWIALRRTANISSGGTAVDVTATVHPDNARLAEHAARIVGLNIAGIDLLTTDITRSWHEAGGAICEVNAQPGLRVHWLADPERDINGDVLDSLLAGCSPRIPVAALTGAGAGAAALLLADIWAAAGKVAGVCTTELVRVGEDVVSTDDLAGRRGGRILITDPAVEAAVMQIPADSVVEQGHPCDRYDVSALTGVDARGAAGAAEVLRRAGRAVVLDAGNPACLALATAPGVRRILVFGGPATDLGTGSVGDSVAIDDRGGRQCVVLRTGVAETDLLGVDELGGHDLGAALIAAAVGWAQGVEPVVIAAALAGGAR